MYYLVVSLFAGDVQCKHKAGEQTKLSGEILLGAIYIALSHNILYHSKLSVIDYWERTVYCLFCNSLATLKPTKTGRIMLRCNTCGALVFANGIISQQRIKTLKDYRFTSVCWLVIPWYGFRESKFNDWRYMLSKYLSHITREVW